MAEHSEQSSDSQVDVAHYDDKPSYDDINTPVVVMIGAISAIVTFLVIAFVQGLYNHWYSIVVEEQQTSQIDSVRAALIEEQKAQLLPNEQGRISIDEAMKNTLDEYRN